MEKKTTQRIIGILVIAALIVILLPLIFNGNTTQATAQTAEVKAPPFPDQSVQATPELNQADNTTSTSANITPDTANTINQNTVAAADNSTNATIPTAPASNAPLVVVNNQPADVPVSTQAATTVVSAPESTEPTPSVAPTVNVPTVNSTAATETTTAKTEIKTAAENAPTKKITVTTKQKPSHEDLVKLKSAAWAVQMGSFKIKTNAERLANQLRAQGYKAFTREIRSSTRVYVGPEFKQASANSLAKKLEQNLNMHGIIVPYNPLEL